MRRTGGRNLGHVLVEGGARAGPDAIGASGIAMMTYLGWQTARKIAHAANYACAYDTPDFPDHPLYTGNPWFLPALGAWYRLRDRIDRLIA